MIALALLLAATPPAFHLEEIPRHEGRPEILLAPRPGFAATIAIRFATGSVHDGDGRSGLTRVAQHALLAANRTLDLEELTVALHAADARLVVATGVRDASFVLTANARDFPALAARLARGLLAPRLDRRRFRVAVERALHDVREPGRGVDLVARLASMIVQDLRYANEPFGDREQIEQLVPEDVEEVLAESMSPANATVVLTGAFDRSTLLAALRGLRGGRRPAAVPPPVAAPLTARSPTNVPLHVVALPFSPRSALEGAASRVLVELLEQEIWRRIRQTGLAYTFAVAPVRSSWLDLVLVVVPVPSSGTDLPSAIDKALDAVRLGQFDEAAFGRARSAALARLRLDDARSEALAGALLAGGRAWHGAGVEAALGELSRGPFLETAAPWLVPGARITVALTAPRGGAR